MTARLSAPALAASIGRQGRASIVMWRNRKSTAHCGPPSASRQRQNSPLKTPAKPPAKERE